MTSLVFFQEITPGYVIYSMNEMHTLISGTHTLLNEAINVDSVKHPNQIIYRTSLIN